LFRLSQGAFEHYGLALANSVVASAELLPEEEKEKLKAMVSKPDAIRTP
jgi:hypothetical protein